MQIKINLTKKVKECRLLLFDHKGNYHKYIKIEYGENNVDIDLSEFKFIRFKIDGKHTENLILSPNIEKLSIQYNLKRKKFNVCLEALLPKQGKIKNVFFTDLKNLAYRSRANKKVTFYFSPGFQNKDVHLIIFFDSQNIYDQRHVGFYTKKADPYGGWQIDVPINNSGKNFIVAGIENADKYRTVELSPNDVNKKYLNVNEGERAELSAGHLDDLGNFITEQILPYLKSYQIVDAAIAGASMGGLAAHYLGLKYPDIFDYIFSLSTASGLYKDSLWKIIYQNMPPKAGQKYFFFQGEADPLEKELARFNKRVTKNIIKAGLNEDDLLYYFDPKLKHNEVSWRYAFNFAFDKFYNKK